MGLSSFTIIIPALIAGCTAFYNLWLYALRPRERAHLWLGVAALGVVWVGSGLAMLYESQTFEEARFARSFAMNCAPFIVIGFLRFTAVLLNVRIQAIEWLSGSATLIFIAAFNLRQDWFFTGATAEMIAPFGETYIQATFTRATLLIMPGFICMFLALTFVFMKYRSRIEASNLLPGSVAFWFLTALNDVAITSGLYEGPYLVAFGFVGFAVAFTGLLQQRFARSVEQLASSTEALQQVVERRTQALREKDMQLTHGSRMATLGAISAGLAEEIRTPVAVVSDCLRDLPASYKEAGDDARFDALIDDARGGTDRIRMIVSDLLRISRREVSDESDIDLSLVVESVLPMLDMEARGRATIETDLQTVPPIQGSETLLAQIVMNLVVRALKPATEGAAGARTVSVRTAFEDDSVWLTVEDDGPGIPEAWISTLFDPFGPAAEHGKDGVGLGLAVTHQIVERHRGEIWFESGERGARFVIEFPTSAASGDPE